MKSLYYDRDGKEIPLAEWCELRLRDGYFRVAASTVGSVWVSTVWLGVDHSFGDSSPPVIFETMTFSTLKSKQRRGRLLFGGEVRPLPLAACWQRLRRYRTEAEALVGHRQVVQEMISMLAVAPRTWPRLPRRVKKKTHTWQRIPGGGFLVEVG